MSSAQRVFPLRAGSKVPAINRWQTVKAGEYTTEQVRGRAGLALNADELVLDLDPRNYPPGRDIFKELKAYLPRTKAVATPSGGLHLYFSNPWGVRVRKKQVRYPGLDCLSYGAYVCAEGTETADGIYVVVDDSPVAIIPGKLLRLFDAVVEGDGSADTEITDDVYNKEKYIAWLKVKAKPGKQGEHGNDTTFLTACYGKDLGLSQDTVLLAMTEFFNPRCSPRWSDAELHTIVSSAYRNGKLTPGINDIKQRDTKLDLVAPPPKQHDKVSKIVKMRDKHIAEGVTKDDKNRLIVNRTTLRYYIATDEYLAGRIFWDDFSQRVMFSEKPIWRTDNRYEGLYWSDHDTHVLVDRLSHSLTKILGDEPVIRALEAHALTNRKHTVTDWLNSLEWDGIKRLDTVLVDTAGAKDSPYVRAVGKNVFLSAVKRVFEPGCLAKSIMILDGGQDKGKSTWVKELSPIDHWVCEGDRLTPGDKDVYQNLRGKWIVELPEIDKDLTTKDKAWLKHFISRRTDTYRKSFGRESYDHPRQSIFIGTINGGSDMYLSDRTGNVRFWIVDVDGDMNIDLLKKLREQYWAEAVYRYRQGEPAFLHTQELKEAAAEVVKKRTQDNWYVGLLAKRLPPGDITFRDCYRVLGINTPSINGRLNSMIGEALIDLGYRRKGKICPVTFERDLSRLPVNESVE